MAMGTFERAYVLLLVASVHGWVLGVICQQLAYLKGSNPDTAFWIGFFTGLIGRLFKVGMTDESKK